jgi:hypothetical protein
VLHTLIQKYVHTPHPWSRFSQHGSKIVVLDDQKNLVLFALAGCADVRYYLTKINDAVGFTFLACRLFGSRWWYYD